MTEEEQAFGTWLATAAADLSKFSQLSDTQKEDIARKMESALSHEPNRLDIFREAFQKGFSENARHLSPDVCAQLYSFAKSNGFDQVAILAQTIPNF